MSKKQRRRGYPAEYRSQLIDLVRSGRKPEDLAEEFEPCSATIERWYVQAEVDSGAREGTTTNDKQEIAQLRREVKRLKVEREILGKAAAWFARETNSVPERGSSS